jgi:hypothetical protein
MSKKEYEADESMDVDHLDLLRRYRDAMRDLLRLSNSEYSGKSPPRRLPSPEEFTGAMETKDDVETEPDPFPGPPLTETSVKYARAVVAPTRRAFSWAVPTTEALAAVESEATRGIIEIGAGTGYWCALLKRRGVKVDAVDLNPCDGEDPNGHHAFANANPPPFLKVRRGGVADALSGSGKGDVASVPALFLCWPPKEEQDVPSEISRMAENALVAYRGNAVLYVGEAPDPGLRISNPSRNALGAETSTGGARFHAALLKDWDLVRTVPLPRWPGARDSLTVWKRRGARPAPRRAPPMKNATDPDHEDEKNAFSLSDAWRRTRLETLREARAAWEMATVAHVSARVSQGGARAMRGPERAALRAVRERSGWFRRIALAFL